MGGKAIIAREKRKRKTSLLFVGEEAPTVLNAWNEVSEIHTRRASPSFHAHVMAERAGQANTEKAVKTVLIRLIVSFLSVRAARRPKVGGPFADFSLNGPFGVAGRVRRRGLEELGPIRRRQEAAICPLRGAASRPACALAPSLCPAT